MPDGENPHHARAVVDGINDPIITDADSIAFARLEFFAACRSRGGFQRSERGTNSLLNLRRKFLEIVFRRRFEDNRVAHGFFFLAESTCVSVRPSGSLLRSSNSRLSTSSSSSWLRIFKTAFRCSSGSVLIWRTISVVLIVIDNCITPRTMCQ